MGNCIAERVNVSPSMQGRDGRLESNSHETRSLGIESVSVQIGSDWHGSEKSSQNFLSVKRKRPIVRAF